MRNPILNNLAATYHMLGMTYQAITLLTSTVPRMRHSLGLGNEAICGAVCNLINFTQGSVLAVGVRDMVRDIQADMTDYGPIAIKSYADFLARNRRFGEAVDLYQKSYNSMMASFGDSDNKTIQCLYCLAHCLNLIQKISEADHAFHQLAQLTAQSPANENLYKTSMTAISALSAKKDLLQAEWTSWGLDKPSKCLCGKNTMRLCSGQCFNV